MKLPLLGQTYEAQTAFVTNQRTINLMFEKAPNDANVLGGLYMTPGEKAWTNAGVGEIARGGIVMNAYLYVVYGNTFYGVDSGGNVTSYGTVAGTERVWMVHNGTQIVIVADSLTYYFSSVDNSFNTITDANFLESSSVCYIDGYFVFAQKGTNQFFLSPLLDDTTGEVDFTLFDATERGRAFTSAGNIVACYADHKELWLFKDDNFIEVWQNTGGDFPFTRLGGAYAQRGCAGKHTIQQSDNTLIWLGEDNVVYRAQGYVPERISNYGLEHAISEMAFIGDAFAQAWDEGGHKLYGLWFPSEGRTFVIDLSNNLWHERQSKAYGYWRVNHLLKCYGKTVILDSESNDIGELDLETFTEYGAEKQAIRIGQTVRAEGRRFSIDRIEVHCESGVGLTTGQGSDPKIGLELSRNHGKTFSTLKKRSLGKIGEYEERAVWRNQGLYRQLTPKILITDPVRRYIIDCYAEVTPRRI